MKSKKTATIQVKASKPLAKTVINQAKTDHKKSLKVYAAKPLALQKKIQTAYSKQKTLKK